MCRKPAQLFRILVLAVAVLWVFCLSLLSGKAHAALQSASVKEIESVAISQDEMELKVTIRGAGPLTYTESKQENPLAIIIDIPEADVSKVTFPADLDTDIIKKISGSFFSDKSFAYSRIEIALEKDNPYTVRRADGDIVVVLQKELASALKEEPAKDVDKTQDTAVQMTSETPACNIVDIAVDASGRGSVKVVISADGILPELKPFPLSNPPRLVIDFPGIKLAQAKKAMSLQHPLLKKIRIAQRKSGVRVVFDSRGTKLFPYAVDQVAETVTVWIGEQKSRKSKQVASRGIGTVEAIDFEPLDQGKVRLTVKADRKLPYEVVHMSKTAVVLRLNHALLPERLARPYDTSYFEGAVDAIMPQRSLSERDTVDITMKMRDDVPFRTVEKENVIQVEFEATTVPPKSDRLVQMQQRLSAGGAETKDEKKILPDGKPPDFPQEFADLAGNAAMLSGEHGDSEKGVSSALPRAELPFGPDKVYTGQKISLDFQSADIHNVLRLLAEVSKLNVVAGPDVSGKVTLKLDKVPWDQALDVVLAANGLGMIRTENVIRIAPLAKLAEEIKRLSELQLAEPLATGYIQVNYGKADKLKEQIEKIRSERGSVTYDERTNKIIIKDTPSVIESARDIVRSLDEPTRQVLIEARIVEATADFSRQLGVQWGGEGTRSGEHGYFKAQGRLANNFAVNPGIPTATDALGAIGFSVGRLGTTIVNLDVRLLAMESDGKVHIVSSPKITTLDHKEAYIQQGSKIPYLKQTQDGVSTEWAEATLKLTVVPHITPDNRIGMSIMAKKDEPDFTTANTVTGVPTIKTKEAKTELLINNGETVVIGGIIYEKKTETTAGIPGLHKIPILGWLFKGQKDTTARTELLIFLSANIIKIEQVPGQS